MAIRQENGENVLLDIALTGLVLVNRLGEAKTKRFIEERVKNIIFFELENKNHINYLNFDLKFDKFGDSLEIKAKNIVTALWFINEWPYEPDYIMQTKKYLTDTGHYRFDGRTKKLTFHEKTT